MSLSGPALRYLQMALLALSDVAWVYAWSVVLGTMAAGNKLPLVALPLVAAVIVCSAVVSMLVLRWIHQPRVSGVMLSVLGLLVAVAVASRGSLGTLMDVDIRLVFAAAIAVVLWWRGMALGRDRVTSDDVLFGFRLGIALLVVVFLLSFLGPDNTSQLGLLTIAGLVVLFAGLVGLPLANVVDLSEITRFGEGPLRVGGNWLGMLLASALGLLGLTLLLSAVFTFDRMEVLFRPVGRFLDWLLSAIVFIIAVPIGFVLQLLLDLYHKFVHPHVQNRPKPPQSQHSLEEYIKQHSQQGSSLPWLLPALKIVVAIVIVLLIVLVLTKVVSKIGERRRRDNVEEVHDFVWTWDAFRADFLAWLRRLFRRPEPEPVAARGLVGSRAREERDPQGIREMYRELLAIGGRLVRRRRMYETPREYDAALASSDRLSRLKPDLDALTEAYVRVRYGREVPDKDSVEAARSALSRIRRAQISSDEDTTHQAR